MIRKFLSLWPIFLIVALTLALRLVKLEQLFYFSYDEAIPAFVARRMILEGHVPLIGGVTPFGFHLAPYFYWFLAGILVLGKLNPIAWGYSGAIIAMATTFLVFLVGKEYFNKKVGFIAATLWTFSTLTNIYDRHLWALYWGPLVSLITLYCLKKIIDGKAKFAIFLGATFALAIHTDPSNLIFIILSSIIFLLYKVSFKKEVMLGFILIAFFLAPLVIFDLKHNFANTKPIISYFLQGKRQANNPQNFYQNTAFIGQVATRVIYPFLDNEIAKNYSYCQSIIKSKTDSVPLVFTIISLFALLLFSVKYWEKYPQNIIVLALVLYFTGLHLFGTLFKSDIFEHYFAPLFPAFILIFAWYLSLLPKKIWLIVIAVFISLNLQRTLNLTSGFGLSHKRQAIEYISQEVAIGDFSLESLSTCWKYQGYRYLFTVFGQVPVKSYVDPNLSHLYGRTQVVKNHPDIVAAIIGHDFQIDSDEFYSKYALYKSHEISYKKFGNLEVIIMDNRKRWFK